MSGIKHTVRELLKPAEVARILDVHTISMYSLGMEFQWDEKKNQENLEKHGLNFEDAQLVFEGEDEKGERT